MNRSNNVFVAPAVTQVIDLYRGLIDDDSYHRSVGEQLKRMAVRLLEGHRDRAPGAAVEISNWHPQLVAKSPEVIWSTSLTELDALTILSREHGYADWNATTTESDRRPSLAFERAVDAVLCGDLPALDVCFRETDNLVTMQSHWGHRATLLHYVGANGVETHRQYVPLNAADVAKFLLERGAAVNARANMYGGNQTVLGLLLTSQHPSDAGVTAAVAEILKTAGAV